MWIKRLPRGGAELEITASFSPGGGLHNHIVPILDQFDDDEDHTSSYIVMPFLSRMDDQPFDLVDDTVDFVDQVLEVCLRLGVARLWLIHICD